MKGISTQRWKAALISCSKHLGYKEDYPCILLHRCTMKWLVSGSFCSTHSPPHRPYLLDSCLYTLSGSSSVQGISLGVLTALLKNRGRQSQGKGLPLLLFLSSVCINLSMDLCFWHHNLQMRPRMTQRMFYNKTCHTWLSFFTPVGFSGPSR